MNTLDFVDTRMGTNNQHRKSNGNALPYTLLPFGRHPHVMISRYNDGRFFNGRDFHTYGIRLTHQPSPWMGDFDFVNFNFLGLTAREEALIDDRLSTSSMPEDFNMSSYDPDTAIFKPNNLNFTRLRDGLNIDMVPSEYGSQIKVEQVRHHKSDKAFYFSVAIARTGEIKLVGDSKIEGMTKQMAGSKYSKFPLFFNIEFNSKLELIGSTDYTDGFDMTMYWFKLEKNLREETLFASLNSSYISNDKASENAGFELAEHGLVDADEADLFAGLKIVAEDKWLDYLNRIEVKSENIEKVRTFYSSLYRTATFPNRVNEYNSAGEAIHHSPYTGEIEDGVFFTNNGYWDTFRTNYPLYSLIAPEMVAEILEGILNIGRQDKFLPRWISPDERGMMPGSSVDSVIADAIVKDLVGPEFAEEILEYMIHSAEEQGESHLEGREGGVEYRKLGYVPADIGVGESVNKTQDYAYSDFCIAQVASKIGKTDIAEQYYRYSYNYRNLYYAEKKQMYPKDSDGNFIDDHNPELWGKFYTEGSAWQNSLSVFYNFEDLINLYGGDDEFAKHMLDLFNQRPEFEIGGYGNEIHEISEMAIIRFGQFAISNQPSFHFPYLFTFAGRPNHTELALRLTMENLFSADAEGFPGDEDNGSMGSWFVLNSLGLYQVCPGISEFNLGINIWDEAKVKLANGNTISFKQDKIKPYLNIVQERVINGEVYNASTIDYKELMEGLEIYQELGLLPSFNKLDESLRPYSLGTEFEG